ncbi:MAG: type III pantothenate kinase [Coriobacteriales bacterium]|jgi:type III pantothenate kinase|nr:type III pantothenate kinase [Coriobacteriales bacterium]
MLLAVDVGNTQTVMGLYEDERLLAHWRVATDAADTGDELALRIHALFALEALGDAPVTDVAIASVVPPLTEQWRQLAARLATTPALIVDSGTDTGLPIAYGDPTEIGADRLADAVAAVELYGAPCIVVDFGTATNIEVIDRTGAFVGGVIAPGLATSAQALFDAAARLAKTSIDVPPRVIGASTREAVQSGLTFGEIDRIDGLVRRIVDELGYPATVIATGGLSARVTGLSRTIDTVNDDLTLEGLRIIHRRVRGRQGRG